MSARSNEPKTERLAVPLSPELAEKVQDFRSANGVKSRAEALRQLVEAALQASREARRRG
jgi:metal-responsive CopG/Arc/MetJ family transcriptional regulator